MNLAAKTRAFWNAHPCDGQPTHSAVEQFRYRKDPWLPSLLTQIAENERDVLEVGCGQGTDGFFLCRRLPHDARYVGIDQSDMSVANARRFAVELAPELSVTPVFKVGSALELPFEPDSFGAVYSMGVLHHIHEMPAAISEIFRVLRPGGSLYLGLYNSFSPKLMAAHALRYAQTALDALTGQDRTLYRIFLNSPYGQRTGTMLHECFGVPTLNSYSANEMRSNLSKFNVESLSSYGFGTKTFSLSQHRRIGYSGASLGYIWVAVARKPMIAI